MPSLDIVIYKLGGPNGQFEPALTGLPQPPMNHDRDNWQKLPHTPFDEGSMGSDSLWRVLSFVCGSVKD